MADIELLVGGVRYAGWKSVRVTSSIESLAGSFAFDVSDRWSDAASWPIAEEDACLVQIFGETVLDGYVDKVSMSASKDARALSYTGRDRAGALVDCSALLDAWTLQKVDVAVFVAKVAAAFGVRVSVQPGLKLAEIPQITFTPGDGAFDVIKRVAGDDGVLVVSDGAGGILITRSGATRATSLIEGQNIHSASVDNDASDRFRHYVIATQTAGTDEAFGDATRVAAGAVDEGVRRTNRVLLIQSDRGYSVTDARKRADWEARHRAAHGSQISVTVLGWKQPSGELWRVNALTRVRAPRLLAIDGDMLISQVEYTIGEGGQRTQLSLVRPDAFTPEPKAIVKAHPAGFASLRKGAAFDLEVSVDVVTNSLDKLLKGGG